MKMKDMNGRELREGDKVRVIRGVRHELLGKEGTIVLDPKTKEPIRVRMDDPLVAAPANLPDGGSNTAGWWINPKCLAFFEKWLL